MSHSMSSANNPYDKVGGMTNLLAAIRKPSLWAEIRKKKTFYLFILPGLIYFIVIKYSPVYFIQVAFRHYRLGQVVSKTPWAGLAYFEQLFNSGDFILALKNTVTLNLLNLLFAFPAPIILSLMLNEVKHKTFKRGMQTIVYLPHFISWVVIGGIIRTLFSLQGGTVNTIIESLGGTPIGFLNEVGMFRGIMVASSIWKDVGWGTIIYLAAIAGISPELYESAIIDGANRFQRMLYITIPSIMYVIVVLLILQIGNMLNTGFEQVLVLYNPLVKQTGLVLDYLVYQNGLVAYRYSFAAAAGLFNTVIALVMVVVSDRIAKSVGQRGIF